MPEAKGKPARVNIYPYPNASGKPIAAKSFYKAQEVDIRWSPAGLAVLIFTHTDVDATGGSYYGSTGLFLLHSSVGSDGSAFDCAVPLPKEGPIGDAQWSPTGREFIVIAGATRSLLRGARLCVSRTFAARPTQTPGRPSPAALLAPSSGGSPGVGTLFNLKAEPVMSFGSAHRNTISWSPHGRFVVLAGFGNLSGGMDFWDRNKKKKLGSTNTTRCARDRVGSTRTIRS